MDRSRLSPVVSLAAALVVLMSMVAAAGQGQCVPGGACPLPAISSPDALVPLVPVLNPTKQQPHPAVVRIINALGQVQSYGSGTLVGRSMVITCAHTFRDGVGRVEVVFAAGGRYIAKVLALDPIWDLAALEIPAVDVAPVAIAAAAPRPGQWLTSCGWGPREAAYASNRGQALGYTRADRQPTCEMLELTGSARGGDSGGPVLNDQGELVAVLWGTDGRTVGGTYCGRVRKFLDRLCPPAAEASPTAKGNQPATANAPEATRPDLEKVQSGLARVEKSLGIVDRLQQRLAEVESKTSLVEKIQARVAGVEDKSTLIDKIQQQVAALKNQPGTQEIRQVARDMALSVLAEKGPTLVSTTLPALLAALGWTGPPAVAIVLLAKIGLGLLARKVESKQQDTTPAASAAQQTVVVEETPPPPQVTVRNREFVPYEVPSTRLQALEFAMDEYVRRYPAARAMIETIENYAKQHQSGQPKAKGPS